MQKSILFIFCLWCLCLAGCSTSQQASVARVQNEIHKIKKAQGFQERRISTSTFTLFALVHPARNSADTLHVYIEGDGLAWIQRNKPSSNPTPTQATALDLASHDPSIANGSASVLYLARPCQYVQGTAAKLCHPKYWTAQRFAPEVITALSEAIDAIKQEVNAQKIVVVGYSGGGPCAALVAAQRSDVTFLGSVAGNLDTEGWTTWHKVSPLQGSLKPMDYVHDLRHIPQRHLSSYDDAIVPPIIGENFCNALYRPEYCEQVSGIEHGGPWHSVWNYTYK